MRIVLEGQIGPGKQGGIRAFFTNLPDEPVSSFVMTLYGGKRGLLVNSADICDVPPVSNVKAIAQNNIGAVFTTKLRGNCAKRGRAAAMARRGTKEAADEIDSTFDGCLTIALAGLAASAVARARRIGSGKASLGLHAAAARTSRSQVLPPPLGSLNGPCGAAVDSAGSFYISDYYHDVVDVWQPEGRRTSTTRTSS